MRVAVLTTVDRGLASACLPELLRTGGVEVALIVHAGTATQHRWRHARRKLGKLLRIGPLGAAIGVHMRAWYTADVAQELLLEPLAELARRNGVRYEQTSSVNAAETRALIRESGAALGLALGCPFISPSVFETPRHGMINIHHELLPEFRGAQSVVWQLHSGSACTGFTIHQISRRIDEGAILWRQPMDIEFGPTLRDTVTRSYARLVRESARTLPTVILRYESLRAAARPQGHGRSYTTPTFREFLEIRRQHRQLGPAGGRCPAR
jgi:methionyl-tRNA formyltransferase